jgi:hypothetical protein
MLRGQSENVLNLPQVSNLREVILLLPDEDSRTLIGHLPSYKRTGQP